MKIVIVTDAWSPQINGVVRTLEQTQKNLIAMGHEVVMMTPESYRTIPCPGYSSVPLAVFPGRQVFAKLAALNADAIHIATEGPLGLAARRWCIRRNIKFTTSYHTQFPEYLRLRLPVPLRLSYAALRRFHNRAICTLVPTPLMQLNLSQRGFKHVKVWSRGVDITCFTPHNPKVLDLPKPVLLNVGRVSVEKNLDAFLSLDIAGSKVVVGEGPDLEKLKRRYPDVLFTGAKFGEELASWIAAADVFVFPSKTDTFGLVLLEAMACGVPVAAYPVTGPKDIVKNGVTGILDEDLSRAIIQAQHLNPHDCIAYAQQHSWATCTQVFLQNLYNNSNPAAPELVTMRV